jgi:divalent metal cation (Fe/Co/Zn/Cd) transporter
VSSSLDFVCSRTMTNLGPTPSQKGRHKERALIATAIADFCILTVMVLVAILTGTLTMLSESLRAGFMLVIEIYSIWLLWSLHRDKLNAFQFGIGKLEQFVWLIIGVGFLVSAIWLADAIISALVSQKHSASPLGLAIAAIVNAVNLLVNYLSWHAMRDASEENETEIYRAQLRARTIKLNSSSILQVNLTIAALSRDEFIALLFDCIGATLVLTLMVWRGVSMLISSLPGLLDAPVTRQLQEKVVSAVKASLPDGMLLAGIRTRRSGQFPHIEITLGVSGEMSVEQVKDYSQSVRTAVSETAGRLDLSITLN